MLIKQFLDTQKTPLGYIYALGENGSYIESGSSQYYNHPARTDLNILRTYMNHIDTDIYGVILVSDAVRQPLCQTTTEKSWLWFGKETVNTTFLYLNEVSMFHFIVVMKDLHRGEIIHGKRYETEYIQSGVVISTRTPDNIEDLFSETRYSSIIMNEKELQPWCERSTSQSQWYINSSGRWCCRMQ